MPRDKENLKQWTEANRARINQNGSNWHKRFKERDYEGYRAYINAKEKRKRDRNKQRVINAYGGKCFCCGEARIEFMSIDHEGGGGNKHRREEGLTAGEQTYEWLIRNNYPPGFRAACYNCNLSLGFLGYCPHERERQAAVIVTPEAPP